MFVFSSLPIRKVLVLPFAGGASPPLQVVSLLFSASYPQDRRSYYLFFDYLFFNYLSVVVNRRRILAPVVVNRRNGSKWCRGE